ncbi:DUF1275 domain-containing protein [Streptomyces sp. NBC_01224]|uniref:DUF1275 family protein n=1 Tax=Streptomyces sp. NBC_01224 TaxID=2903783 RepID=UPI002E0F0500|nr:DUF1275 domain-containing protein [Streptomyces sp. NBC_01224]
MIGNVVFLGFALAGADGLSVLASVVSMAAFLVGALAGGAVPRSGPRILWPYSSEPSPAPRFWHTPDSSWSWS